MKSGLVIPAALRSAYRAALIIMLYGSSPAGPAAAENTYERDLAAALVERTGPGEVIWLAVTGDRFPGIYQQHLLEPAQGAVLILHGMGQHMDWPEVIAPLRLNLPIGGWATLAIQLPVLEPGAPLSGYGATISRAEKRIATAVSYLRDIEFRNIVLIGHGFGAVTGAAYLADSGTGIQAFVGINMRNFDMLQPRLDLNDMLARITIPVLDLYGSRDHVNAQRLAEQRRLEAEKMNPLRYQQITIGGTDHHYTGLEDIMIQSIRGWLDEIHVVSNRGAAEITGSENLK